MSAISVLFIYPIWSGRLGAVLNHVVQQIDIFTFIREYSRFTYTTHYHRVTDSVAEFCE